MEKKLDFTEKNIVEIVEKMRKGTITEEELQEAAENTSKIVGFPVKWMGTPFGFIDEDYTRNQRKKLFWWQHSTNIRVFVRPSDPEPKQTKLTGDKENGE